MTNPIGCRNCGELPMITLRRAEDRYHDRRHKQEVWHSFHAEDRADVLADGFGTLEMLNEDRLPPGANLPPHPHHDAEILTYVREGALAHEDSRGRSGVIRAGEFQCRTARNGIRHSETNASRVDWAHIFQIWVRPSEAGLEPSHQQKRFCVAERRGVLCVVASPDGRRGSLRVHQAALVYSAMLDPGQHAVHELAQGHRAWLHIVQGEAMLGDVVLTTGDGVGVTAERAVSLTAREETEILLLDLGVDPPQSRKN
jgi:redox-sensitive bicupin YhaK (pirin superfamily)